MRRGVRTSLGVVVLATLVIGIAACGNDGDDRTTAPAAANATPRADADDLGRYLMRRDEEPGFRPGAAPGAMPSERGTVTGVKALVSEWRLSAADERRLSSEGFISLTSQPIRGPGSAGVTEVSLYETAQGAKRSLAHELRAGRDPRGRPRREAPVLPRPGCSRRARLDRVAARRAGEPRASGTSSGCRVAACTSSETRAPVPSSARCRGARGRSMNARATSARARSRPGHRGARACERHSPRRSRSPSPPVSWRSPAAAMTLTAGRRIPRPGAPGRAGDCVIRRGCRRPLARPAGSPRTNSRSRIAA